MKTFLQFFLLVDYVRDADLELELLMRERIGTFFSCISQEKYWKSFSITEIGFQISSISIN